MKEILSFLQEVLIEPEMCSGILLDGIVDSLVDVLKFSVDVEIIVLVHIVFCSILEGKITCAM